MDPLFSLLVASACACALMLYQIKCALVDALCFGDNLKWIALLVGMALCAALGCVVFVLAALGVGGVLR